MGGEGETRVVFVGFDVFAGLQEITVKIEILECHYAK